MPLFVGREKSVAALEGGDGGDKELFLVAQLDPGEDDPDRDALYDLGVVATAMQLLKLPDGTVRVLVEGAGARGWSVWCRGATGSWRPRSSWSRRKPSDGPEVAALMRSVIEQFANYAKLNKKLPAETSMQLGEIDDPSILADAVASNLSVKVADKQALLSELDPAQAARDGVRLHGGRARRAPGREEDPRPGQAADGEDPARILSQRAAEGDPARAWQ